MNSEGSNKDRRRLLKKLAVGGGVVTTAKALPDQWSKPVIESVITPAHAVTTSKV